TVSTTGERGLLGIAFDPNFATEKWVYLYYTSPSGPHNRVSRFMVSPSNPDVAAAGSEQVLFDLPATLATSGFHNGGSIHFVEDVGANSQEEIDDLKAGANYGWPSSEGNSNTAGFTAPIHAYSHSVGCAITGGAFYNPASATFPASMVGHYFFGDYCHNDIR